MKTENITRLMNVRDDTKADAAELDGTDITPESLGEIFGNLLAMVWCLSDVLLDEESSNA